MFLFQHGMSPRPGVMGEERTCPTAAAEVCSSRASPSTRKAMKWQVPIAIQYHCLPLYSGYTKPGPVISCQSPSYQQKPSLRIYSLPIFTWTSSSHWEKPAQTSGKHISATYISADLQILPICAASHWKSHRAVCQTWGDDKLRILAWRSYL